MMVSVVILLLSTAGPLVHTARILGMAPMWAKSHHQFIQPVMRALAQAGHEVVVYSPFPLYNPPSNYSHIHLASIKTESQELTDFFLRIAQFPHWKCFDAAWYIHDMMYRDFMAEPKIKPLLSSSEKFDLIVTEAFTAQEYTLILGHILKAPVIVLQAFTTNNIINSESGNSLSLSFSPGACSTYSDKMSFVERFVNSFTTARDLYNYYNYQLKSLEQLMRKDFPDMPTLQELSSRVSLVLVNDHMMADYALPRSPNLIPVAGIHFEAPKPLPQNILTFVDNAKDGFIWFSLGTYVQDELQPQKYFDMYINVFKKLNQRVLWKTRKANITNLPANVMTVKWASQQDILAHRNCVLFITHGGLLSQHETVYHGVPVIGIPQFFDQHRNVRFYEERGVGVKIEVHDLSENTIFKSIRQVLDNSSYRENMKRLSAIFKDRPMSPAESVVFWTEYVLRHGGASHLRPASIGLRWYQVALLDVVIFLLALILGCIIALFWSIKIITSSLYKNKEKVIIISKKND